MHLFLFFLAMQTVKKVIGVMILKLEKYMTLDVPFYEFKPYYSREINGSSL